MVDLNDSTKVVQVHLVDGTSFAEKQLGLLMGMYRDAHADTITIGSGRCNLIKGEYFYFTINYKSSGVIPRAGDLLYTLIGKPSVYDGRLLKVAAHYIGLQDVYETPLFDRSGIFTHWSQVQEKAVLDSIVKDIHFTGDYFLKNNPSMNVPVKEGPHKGKMVLNMMTSCTVKDVMDFLDYMIARPRLYAGHLWKASEVFATWLSEGAPTMIR